MSRLLELYEKRGKAVADARAFLDAKRGDSDILSAEDSTTYERMEADMLIPLGFMLLHIALAAFLLRGRKLVRLLGVFTGIACGLSGWMAFLFVAAGSANWSGRLGLFCFFVGVALLIAEICVTAFAKKEAPR